MPRSPTRPAAVQSAQLAASRRRTRGHYWAHRRLRRRLRRRDLHRQVWSNFQGRRYGAPSGVGLATPASEAGWPAVWRWYSGSGKDGPVRPTTVQREAPAEGQGTSHYIGSTVSGGPIGAARARRT
jgi:hypothetical protein